MTLEKKAARSGVWFAGLSTFSQALSWLFTMYIARLLRPEDYGLMTMAAFLTSYMEVFSELGLGSAIIQRKEVSRNELSSIFWLSIFVGAGLCCSCFVLAFPTAWIFENRQVIPVTFMISALFIIGSAMTVPYNMLRRDFGFRKLGMINVVSVIISNSAMVLFAINGYGVYTLIWGTIILRISNTFLVFTTAGWRPEFRFVFNEVKPFLKFGVNLAGSSTLIRVFESLDKLIVGRVFNARNLGYYGFASTLASLPIDKIGPIFQQILFPLLSRFQEDWDDYCKIYFRSLKYYTLIVVPLFICGVVFGKEIIVTILGYKWEPIIPFFKAFCIAKLFDSLSEFCNLLHVSRGHTKVVFRFAIVKTLVMFISILIAALHSFASLTIPWALVYSCLCIGWILYSLKANNVGILTYLKMISSSFYAAFIIAGGILVFRLIVEITYREIVNRTVLFGEIVVIGGILYVCYILLFERKLIRSLRNLMGE